jgi:hypothetical protein
MKKIQHIVRGSVLMGLIALASGCIVAEPRDGYYERDHHRYYREHRWHECHEHDEYCR